MSAGWRNSWKTERPGTKNRGVCNSESSLLEVRPSSSQPADHCYVMTISKAALHSSCTLLPSKWEATPSQRDSEDTTKHDTAAPQSFLPIHQPIKTYFRTASRSSCSTHN
ncbi:hypothetical protein J6590_076678 [Homalodisca vitripennis]|nr:hypothetical protein J6590_076678 [Homalodisca vitripennis]